MLTDFTPKAEILVFFRGDQRMLSENLGMINHHNPNIVLTLYCTISHQIKSNHIFYSLLEESTY